MGENAKHQITEWYDDYSLSLFKYILKMIHDAQQAEDLTHDTFIKAYTYVMKGKEVTYPKTFLYRTAHNLTIDHIRKHKPIQMIKDFFSNREDPGPSVEKLVEIRESSQELFSALSRLKPNYRQVIILRRIEVFSVKETAEILDWSESKVKSTLFRGLQKLEEELQKGGVMNETQ
ncbi:RNA polymerase sigma factor SigX [Lentibacillus sp. JNUCC-1]|uniref:RNA polymerase sigma factor n=1 Tax=Lentibacillus sp. JNUCC-1 TaxID=2654513 RepID=UPI0012E8CE63|nr:RNA polymerase sigma factor [Lentibacillus sp. JNUCC-1]MUV38222.1 RNA polymerase sigma factor SigX [Lentibacillus sp. JNUCC-1]